MESSKTNLNKPTQNKPIQESTSSGSQSLRSTGAPAQVVVDEKDVPKYQHYHSARISMRLVTKAGKKITFTGFEYYTQDKDVIAYLDAEIEQGLPGITKGKLMTFAEKDPTEKLRRELKEELREEMAQEATNKALGITKDMGDNRSAGQPSINPTNSGQTAS